MDFFYYVESYISVYGIRLDTTGGGLEDTGKRHRKGEKDCKVVLMSSVFTLKRVSCTSTIVERCQDVL